MTIDLPAKIFPLTKPCRYKVLYGGRGGAKSWGIASLLLLMGSQKPLRILCAREFQNSISDSVHRLLADRIASMGLEGFYQILNTAIRGMNGTEFAFAGLRHNITKIKSFEGVDIVWVEEANTVSKASWETLIPTIRKEGSEIWMSFNPELATDETYQRFVMKPPKDAMLIEMGWRDNKWFPDVLRAEMEQLKERDQDAWLNIWEGKCRTMLEGAVYANELRKAEEDGRITSVPHVTGKPVTAYLDLGWADNTSIWFVQSIGHEFRNIDCYQSQFQKTAHYISAMQNKGYVYGRIVLPHDATHQHINSERTVERQFRDAFPNANVVVLPRLDVKTGIEAGRQIFSQCVFDATRCADGLNALRHYRYDKDESTGLWSKNPLHDEHSHYADAFRYEGVDIAEVAKAKRTQHAAPSWLG